MAPSCPPIKSCISLALRESIILIELSEYAVKIKLPLWLDAMAVGQDLLW